MRSSGTRNFTVLKATLLVVMLALLAGCGSQGPTSTLADELKTVRSWVATVQMAADAWSRGRVPSAYAKETLLVAQAELKQERQMITQLAGIDAAQRAHMTQQFDRVQHITDTLRTSVENGDHAAATRELLGLAQAEQALVSAAKASGNQP